VVPFSRSYQLSRHCVNGRKKRQSVRCKKSAMGGRKALLILVDIYASGRVNVRRPLPCLEAANLQLDRLSGPA